MCDNKTVIIRLVEGWAETSVAVNFAKLRSCRHPIAKNDHLAFMLLLQLIVPDRENLWAHYIQAS